MLQVAAKENIDFYYIFEIYNIKGREFTIYFNPSIIRAF